MTTQISGTTGVSQIQDGAVTQTDLGANVAGNGPAFSAHCGVNTQSIVSGVDTKVSLQTEVFDTTNAFDSITNYRFQPSVAGYYQINGGVRASSGTFSGFFVPTIFKNGASYRVGVAVNAPTVGSVVSVSDVVYLNGSTDYIELYINATGTSLVIGAGSVTANNFLSGYLVRAA